MGKSRDFYKFVTSKKECWSYKFVTSEGCDSAVFTNNNTSLTFRMQSYTKFTENCKLSKFWAWRLKVWIDKQAALQYKNNDSYRDPEVILRKLRSSKDEFNNKVDEYYGKT